MNATTLIHSLEQQGFKLSIFGKSRLRVHQPSVGHSLTHDVMAQLIEGREEIIEQLRARAAVQVASPQRKDEPPIVREKGKPLTEQQLKLIDALTYAHTVAQAGRIAGYGTRQAAHKAYNALLKRLPGLLRRALSTWCIRQNDEEF